MIKKIITSVSLISLTGISAMAAPILFHAKLDTSAASATHKLLLAEDAAQAPHPFYKNYCQGKKAHPYSDATGEAILIFYPKQNRLKYAIAYQGISGQAIMAHFHIGKEGVMGPIVQTICGNPPPGSKALGYSRPAINGRNCPKGDAGFLTGSFKLKGNTKVSNANTTKKVHDALLNGQLYINFHTCLNEPGEIRGQILKSKS